MVKPKKIVITGPTASGKSALALAIAQKTGAVIINADSQQVYREIPILSAQPTEQEKKVVPHVLYGILNGSESCNVAKWIELANEQISLSSSSIIVGGTGMYINALLNGLSPIPEIPDEIRAKVRAMPIEDVSRELRDRADGNTQRMRRGLEVYLTTGKFIDEFHAENPKSPVSADYTIFNLIVSRETVYNNINQRFLKMVENGGMEEVENLIKLDLNPALPIMKACGVPELASYLRRETNLDNAISKAQQSSRNYAKRQMTWFRNQMPPETINITSLDDALKAIGY